MSIEGEFMIVRGIQAKLNMMKYGKQNLLENDEIEIIYQALDDKLDYMMGKRNKLRED